MEAFWIWFVRPFAEIAAGLVIVAVIVAAAFAWVFFQDYVVRPFKRWRKNRAA